MDRKRVAKKEAGMRLLQFLRENCPEAPSVKTLKRAVDGKCCTVNGRIETFSSYILEENDIVVLNLAGLEKKTAPLSVLYEDDQLLIVNKPAGVVSDIRSLYCARLDYANFDSARQSQIEAKRPNEKDHSRIGKADEEDRFGKVAASQNSHNRAGRSMKLPGKALVHRLDKETTGILILTKTASAKEKMLALFKERGIRKLYLAIVDGVMEKDEGKIDNFLGKKYSYQGQTVYGSTDQKDGERAITYWKCLAKGKTASVVSCEPYTGRTHQLRVHLSGIKHPILGDVQYGKKFICPYKPQRNLLHAYRLVFKHPSTGKEINVTAPIPADFKQALTALKVCLDGASGSAS